MGPILGGTPFIRYGSGVKICCDGNSLTESHGSGTPYPTQLAALAPLNGLVTVVNTGISGQTTQNMIDSAADVEAAYDATKTNILVCMEGTNSIYNGRTAAQAASDMGNYIAARLAAQPARKIILLTCTPRQLGVSDADNAVQNAIIDAYNVILRSNYLAYGAKLLVDLRQPGSPWSAANFPDYTTATFNASAAGGWWAAAEVGTGGLTHFSTTGYGAMAQMVATALRRLPRR